jgi:hypothetical protein
MDAIFEGRTLMLGNVVACSTHPEFGEGLCTLYSVEHGAFICYNNQVVRHHICKPDEVVYIRKGTEEDKKKFGSPR